MAEHTGFNFDALLPGFDFLKQFAQANPAAAMPSAAQWVTPMLDPAELDKRIQELKSVQFWLDQNAKALSATIQALEVQRMTLSTLQSMNVGMADVAAAMSGKPAGQNKPTDKAGPAVVDPMQWWGAIGQQFQTIATQAVADMQKHAGAFDTTAANATAAKRQPAKKTAATRKPAASKSTAAAASRRKVGG
jgi:hypothetical protein